MLLLLPSPSPAPAPVLLQPPAEPGQAALAKQHFKPPVFSWLRSPGSPPHGSAHGCPGSSAGTRQDRGTRRQRKARLFESQLHRDLPETTAKLQSRCFISRKVKRCSVTDARLQQALEKPQLFRTKLPRKKMLHISAVSLVLSSIFLGCKAFSARDTPHSHTCNFMQHQIKLPESCIFNTTL